MAAGSSWLRSVKVNAEIAARWFPLVWSRRYLSNAQSARGMNPVAIVMAYTPSTSQETQRAGVERARNDAAREAWRFPVASSTRA
ncbi:hypothetical protein AC482_05555 [miscellaneous Crenarchaeota group-15 archaeon DG-45]|uniref:Uncharacterized protein n=1 Tax=miscellaneous Crenarchaeota group-15 archaeon DG-45 TaxID=1685127 RepID=A0A0M0BN58_9ARCH|nr:MAG: hypothetical protein AC482_05555 [miscellaneous Crenarchaeota group-15 archaeon DG-45]